MQQIKEKIKKPEKREYPDRPKPKPQFDVIKDFFECIKERRQIRK